MRPAIVIALISAGLLQDAYIGAEPSPPPDVVLRATARLADPTPVPYAATVLGRATHRVRLALGNPSNNGVSLAVSTLRWSAARGGVSFPCEDGRDSPRGTTTIAARSTRTFDASVTCDLPLPGDYDVSVRVDTATATVARAIFSITVTGGPNAPVRLGWDPRAWVAVTGTREVRPNRAEARVVIATINGTTEPLGIETFTARLRLLAPGSKAPICKDQIVPIEIRRKVPAGRVHQAWATLDCPAPSEGAYAIDVAVHRDGSEVVNVARYGLRVRNGPLLPLPQ